MGEFNLEAIRARDRDYNDIFEEQARMSPDIAHRLVAWPVADRRALLAAYDALAARLAEVEIERDNARAAAIQNKELVEWNRARLAEVTSERDLLVKDFADAVSDVDRLQARLAEYEALLWDIRRSFHMTSAWADRIDAALADSASVCEHDFARRGDGSQRCAKCGLTLAPDQPEADSAPAARENERE